MVTKKTAATPKTIPAEQRHLSAKVVLHHYRYPKTKAHVSGEYAIVLCEVKEVLSGAIPEEAFDRKNCICITGRMPRLEEGMDYFFQGILTNDDKWGLQYNSNVMRLAYNLDTEENQRKFFGFFLTERQIDLLFDAYDNPIDLLSSKNITALTAIKGIGPVTAQRLCLKYEENVENGRAYIELEGLGLTKNALDKLIEEFGSPDVVVDLIKENPYRLITLVRGYGWVRADAIAQKQGFKTNCPERVLAYTQYYLYQKSVDGHSCCDADELVAAVVKECAPITTDEVVSIMKPTMCSDKEFDAWYRRITAGQKDLTFPTLFYSSAKRQIGTFYLRTVEEGIKQNLIRLKNATSDVEYNQDECEQIIKKVEKAQGFTYTHEQTKAIWSALNNNLVIITGSAGTGKSSVLAPLVKIFEEYGLNVAQCALSGRAASLLTEYTHLNGKTIHRLLRYVPETGQFQYNKDEKMPYDVIILDETSMVGEELFLSLISAIENGSKLILLGDTKQLPPINVGNLLHDMITSGYIPTNVLTIIQRQAQKSGIVSQSLLVCSGKSLCKNDAAGSEVRGDLKDFKLITHSDAMLVHAKAVEEFKHLYQNEHISPDDIQIVVPVRVRGMNSCRFFNAEIQSLVNNDESKRSVEVNCVDGDIKYTVTYRVDDRIMIIHNNYHAKNLRGQDIAVFNGNMGHIVDIYKDMMVIQMDKEDDEEGSQIMLPRSEWGDITHAWCSTCHKLQGSQAKYVIVVLDNSSFPLLIREWLYTAITRARVHCTLVGQPKAINTATRNSDVKIKQTWLKDELYHTLLKDEGVE